LGSAPVVMLLEQAANAMPSSGNSGRAAIFTVARIRQA